MRAIPFSAATFVIAVFSWVLGACGVDQRAPPPRPIASVSPGDGLPAATGGAPHQAEAAALSLTEIAQRTTFTLAHVQLSTGDRVHLVVENGRIDRFEPGDQSPTTDYFDASAYFAVPAFIDSHVHLTYFSVAEALAKGGVLAAVDLAAPIDSLEEPMPFLELLSSGPMITSIKGYPTQSWGSNGYGFEVDGVSAAREAAEELLRKGAQVIKIPLDGEPVLQDDEVEAVVEVAHKAGVKVAVHALSDVAASRAAALGCDLLAHTPTEELAEETISAWSGKAVVSTLGAFGRSEAAISNLRRLYAAGATVLYGTDLGNSRTVGIDVAEILLLEQAGLSRSAALGAGTTVAAKYWKLKKGELKVGGEASFLLAFENPETDLETLIEPAHVIYSGRLLAK